MKGEIPGHGHADPARLSVRLLPATLKRAGRRGDNWCMTVAPDGSLVTSMCDGDWLHAGRDYHNHLYRLTGGPEDFTREDLPGYPDLAGTEGSWFGYGLASVDNALYSAVSKTPDTSWSGPFLGIKLLKSMDNGRTWSRIDRRGRERPLGPLDPARNIVDEDEMFFLRENGRPHESQEAYPFSFVEFLDHGAGPPGEVPDDGCIYIYSPEGAAAHELLLARAPKDKLGLREAWEYCTGLDHNGSPAWSADPAARRPIHRFPQQSADGYFFGWYSWLPSVVWNPGLGLYIMANGGTYAGHGMTESDKDYYDRWMHTRTGSLGFWCSPHPWGPWQEIWYTDYWTVDDPGNLTYQPKLAPSWISEDGREMVLVWSDAGKDENGRSHSIHYVWNQIKIRFDETD